VRLKASLSCGNSKDPLFFLFVSFLFLVRPLVDYRVFACTLHCLLVMVVRQTRCSQFLLLFVLDDQYYLQPFPFTHVPVCVVECRLSIRIQLLNVFILTGEG
jgi:hypothetical protein